MSLFKKTLEDLRNIKTVISDEGDIEFPEGYLAKTVQALVLEKKNNNT